MQRVNFLKGTEKVTSSLSRREQLFLLVGQTRIAQLNLISLLPKTSAPSLMFYVFSTELISPTVSKSLQFNIKIRYVPF